MDQAKQKKKDKDEDREENDLTEVASRSSTQVFSPRDSMSSKQTVGQESLLSKSYRSRVFLKDTRAPTGKGAESQATSVVRNGAGGGGGGGGTSFSVGYFSQWFLDDVNPYY